MLMDSNIDIKITNNKEFEREVDKIKFQKMIFLYNALDGGWSIKKRGQSYIFTKNHEQKKEIFDERIQFNPVLLFNASLKFKV